MKFLSLSYQIYWYAFLHYIHLFSHLNNSFNEVYFMDLTIHPYIVYISVWVFVLFTISAELNKDNNSF